MSTGQRLPIKIHLPAEFLDGEIRNGYRVEPKLKKIWAVELDLFNELSRVCRKHDIKFQVFAGTLLGAIRHDGFIPWDDDFDVCMDRVNYRRLCKVAAHEFSSPYFFQTAFTDRRYFLPYARLRNSNTTAAVTGVSGIDYNSGIYIDIHVLDGSPRSSLLLSLQEAAVRLMGWVVLDRLGVVDVVVRKKTAKIVRAVFSFFRYETLIAIYDFICRVSGCFCKQVAILGSGIDFLRRYRMNRADLRKTVVHRYELYEVPVPEDYHSVLSGIYGDYMKFPPPEERGKWHEGKIHFEPDIPYKEYFARMGKGK